MPRSTRSQWDFGELFPAEQVRPVLTVAELTGKVRSLLEQQFGTVWVGGEISNLRLQTSGHAYFALKDPDAQLQCVLFRGQSGVDRQLLQDGRKVVLSGALTVYEPRGQYQLRVASVELQGVGALQAAFERLKLKLQTEGLFDAARKRPLPRFPMRIGLVTSPTGAAIRDVLHVMGRRNPAVRILLAPCRVQGAGAAAEIVEAIELLNRWHAEDPRPDHRLDLILITRGGGSIEDLWSFNEEIVARAIAASALPVVSAVGHEIDFTISDFVADFRAATPSAAAEILTEDVQSARQWIPAAFERLRQHLDRALAECHQQLEGLASRLARCHPRRRIEERAQRLDEIHEDLTRAFRGQYRQRRTQWTAARQRWSLLRPSTRIATSQQRLAELQLQLARRARGRLDHHAATLRTATARLALLSPNQILRRGYSVTFDAKSGQILRSVQNAAPGAPLKTLLADGTIESTVKASSGEP